MSALINSHTVSCHSVYLAASYVAAMAATALLLVADVATDILSVLAQVGTGLLNRVTSTATLYGRALSAGGTVAKVTDRLARVDVV